MLSAEPLRASRQGYVVASSSVREVIVALLLLALHEGEEGAVRRSGVLGCARVLSDSGFEMGDV